VDLKYPEFSATKADEFVISDLRFEENVRYVMDMEFDEVYQLAADMGGAGYIFTGEHDADVMTNSVKINLNVAKRMVDLSAGRLFYSSSACVYPKENQTNPANPRCDEASAFPANPDSTYGWEKLFSEILYDSYRKNYGLDVRIARFHNIFGPRGSWNNGKEKAPAAICRKVAKAKNGDAVEIWGSGNQTRSFLYIDECLEGVQRLMVSDVLEPVNIGSEQMVSINDLVHIVADIAKKYIEIKHVDGPVGVAGRNSDNRKIKELLGWAPSKPLREGLEKLYDWVEQQTKR
jgi:nucleoside-diphosphate-sugar epimerase